MDCKDEAGDVLLDEPVSENVMMPPLCCGLLRAAVDSLCLAGWNGKYSGANNITETVFVCMDRLHYIYNMTQNLSGGVTHPRLWYKQFQDLLDGSI
jgi:hypothetical protein